MKRTGHVIAPDSVAWGPGRSDVTYLSGTMNFDQIRLAFMPSNVPFCRLLHSSLWIRRYRRRSDRYSVFTV